VPDPVGVVVVEESAVTPTEVVVLAEAEVVQTQSLQVPLQVPLQVWPLQVLGTHLPGIVPDWVVAVVSV